MIKTLNPLAVFCALLGLVLFQAACADAEPHPDLLEEQARIQAMLPVPGALLNAASAKTWKIRGRFQINRLRADEGIPAGKMRRVEVKKQGPKPFNVVAIGDVDGGISKGDTIFIALWARAHELFDGSATGQLSAIVLERGSPNYARVARGSTTVGTDWKLYFVSGTADRDFAPGSTHISIHLAGVKQTIDLGPWFVFNLGPDVSPKALPFNQVQYPGQAGDAPWRAAAAQRIDDLRKSNLTVRVQNKDGKPLNRAQISVEMTKHAFLFGSFTSSDFASNRTRDGRKRREMFQSLFNAGTVPLYWADWGWQDRFQRRRFLKTAKWMDDKGLAWRGHPVLYPGRKFMPRRLLEIADDRPALRSAVLRHVGKVSKATRRYNPMAFDALNEPLTGPFLENKAGTDTIVEAYRILADGHPHAALFVNEAGILTDGGRQYENIDGYHDWIRRMLDEGMPLGGIGFQGHFSQILTDPGRIVDVLTDFARYGLPLHITEFDIDILDEAAQAAYTDDVLTAAFSHPAMEAFIIWGFWEGDQWKPKGSMLRKDWSAKPNYHVWKKKIYEDWWTQDRLEAGEDGLARTRGFHGLYRLRATYNGKRVERTIMLREGGADVTLTIG